MESLQKFNTPAKLHNFKRSVDEVNTYKEKLKILARLDRLQEKIKQVNEIVLYLKTAQTYMLEERGHTRTGNVPMWFSEVDAVLDSVLAAILERGEEENNLDGQVRKLKSLKEKYIAIYLALHSKARLNAAADNKRQQLLQDERLKALKQLKEIDILPGSKCDTLIDRITAMKPCWSLTKQKMEKVPPFVLIAFFYPRKRKA